MILVVASMKVELEGLFGLDRSFDHWNECELKYTGIGRENVAETLNLVDYSLDREGLLSVGFVGSIDPGVKPGELCLIEAVGSTDKTEMLYPDEELLELAGRSLNGDYRTCKLLTLNKAASSPEDKRSLGTEEVSVIDQETFWTAEIAAENGIPFLAMRVVVDGVDQALPPESCYDGDTGEVKPGRFTSWLIHNPTRLSGLPGLGWNSVKARRRLGEAINDVLPALLG